MSSTTRVDNTHVHTHSFHHLSGVETAAGVKSTSSPKVAKGRRTATGGEKRSPVRGRTGKPSQELDLQLGLQEAMRASVASFEEGKFVVVVFVVVLTLSITTPVILTLTL